MNEEPKKLYPIEVALRNYYADVETELRWLPTNDPIEIYNILESELNIFAFCPNTSLKPLYVMAYEIENKNLTDKFIRESKVQLIKGDRYFRLRNGLYAQISEEFSIILMSELLEKNKQKTLKKD